jgi:hypothetical protein
MGKAKASQFNYLNQITLILLLLSYIVSSLESFVSLDHCEFHSISGCANCHYLIVRCTIVFKYLPPFVALTIKDIDYNPAQRPQYCIKF